VHGRLPQPVVEAPRSRTPEEARRFMSALQAGTARGRRAAAEGADPIHEARQTAPAPTGAAAEPTGPAEAASPAGPAASTGPVGGEAPVVAPGTADSADGAAAAGAAAGRPVDDDRTAVLPAATESLTVTERDA
ncbi:hypothetical protein DLJ47_08860, partial [Micromonospora sp. S4605]